MGFSKWYVRIYTHLPKKSSQKGFTGTLWMTIIQYWKKDFQLIYVTIFQQASKHLHLITEMLNKDDISSNVRIFPFSKHFTIWDLYEKYSPKLWKQKLFTLLRRQASISCIKILNLFLIVWWNHNLLLSFSRTVLL